MTKAILYILRNEAGATFNFPVGQLGMIDLICGVKTHKIFTEVFINSSFAEFATAAPGRIPVVKVSNPCENTFAYVIGRSEEISKLTDCCHNSKNESITLSCNTNGVKTVFDVLGNNIGTATTPAEYVSVWNSSIVNNLIGVLYLGNGWNFILKHYTGTFRPESLQCDSPNTWPERKVEWEFFNDEPLNLSTLLYGKNQVHVAGEDIAIPLTGMESNTWFVMRYPSDESNYFHWFNTTFQGIGTIPDFVFYAVQTIGLWKYIKTRNASTFDINEPLIFSL